MTALTVDVMDKNRKNISSNKGPIGLDKINCFPTKSKSTINKCCWNKGSREAIHAPNFRIQWRGGTERGTS